MSGNFASSGDQLPPYQIYHEAAGLAIRGAVEAAERTVVEFGGSVPVPPPLMPPGRYVPVQERMRNSDPLVGSPIRPEPYMGNRRGVPLGR